MIKITPIEVLTFSAWEEMWIDYAGQYASNLNPSINKSTYNKLTDSSTNLHGITAIIGHPAGFAQFFYHPSTWSISEVCYLQDLYVCPSSRRQGIGKRLIAEVATIARERGCSELNWKTRKSNVIAQTLYEQIAEQTELIPYRIVL